MQVKIKKLHPDAVIPTYGSDGAACFDLTSVEDVVFVRGRAVVGTGLSFEIPVGYALYIKPRSGLAFKQEIEAFQGTIDSDYRGEVKVLLKYTGQFMRACAKGERIAQAMILPVPKCEFVEVEELSDTQRGNGGFGSTGR